MAEHPSGEPELPFGFLSLVLQPQTTGRSLSPLPAASARRQAPAARPSPTPAAARQVIAIFKPLKFGGIHAAGNRAREHIMLNTLGVMSLRAPTNDASPGIDPARPLSQSASQQEGNRPPPHQIVCGSR